MQTFLGKHHTEETKKKISDARKGMKFTDKQKLKMSQNRKNNPKFQPPSTKGKKKVTNGIINKYIHKDDLDEFLKNNKDFVLGTKERLFKNKLRKETE